MDKETRFIYFYIFATEYIMLYYERKNVYNFFNCKLVENIFFLIKSIFHELRNISIVYFVNLCG